MIEEIFITYNNKVIIGDPNAYPINPEYPTHVLKNKQLTQLTKNDLVLSALYTELDVFFILDYLQKLSEEIENKVSQLNFKNSQDHYFTILEIINKYKVVINPEEKPEILPRLHSNDVFVDVIETYNVVINNGKTYTAEGIADACQDIVVPNINYDKNNILKKEIMGFCFIKPNFNDLKTVKLVMNKNGLNYVSKNKVIEKFNRLEVELDVTNRDLEVIKYISTVSMSPPVNLCKENGGYKLITENVFFESLEIEIPVPEEIKKINIKNTQGEAVLDENMSVVKWRFNDMKVKSCFIAIDLETFSDGTSSEEVNIKFKIPQTTKTHLKIDKAVCLGHPGINVWIKYGICSGTYKIRI